MDHVPGLERLVSEAGQRPVRLGQHPVTGHTSGELDATFSTSAYDAEAEDLDAWPTSGRWLGVSGAGSPARLDVTVSHLATRITCDLELVLPPNAPYAWDDIVGVDLIQADDTMSLLDPAPGYGFTLIARMSDGEQVQIQGGSTCFPVDDCADDGTRASPTPASARGRPARPTLAPGESHAALSITAYTGVDDIGPVEVEEADCDEELLDNGDLEQGSEVRPDSDLSYDAACPDEGEFTITGESSGTTGFDAPMPASSSFRLREPWIFRRIEAVITRFRASFRESCMPSWIDHTLPTGEGHYLLAGATSSVAAGDEPEGALREALWTAEVTVEPGQSYRFSAWVMAADAMTEASAPTLLLAIDGAPLVARALPSTPGFWRPLEAGWTAEDNDTGESFTATLAVVRELPWSDDGGMPATGRVGVDDVVFQPAECDPSSGCAVEPFPTVEIDPVASCEEALHATAAARAETRYQDYLDEQRAAFLLAYQQECMEVGETFTLSHEDKEHQYTLYHYDRAGNLVATTPPLAVRPNRDPAWLAEAAKARDQANESPVLPEHLSGLQSTYAYDSWGRLTHQDSPDGGKVRYLYDQAGRLRFSQSARQVPESFSYVRYDQVGRVVETGELALRREPTTAEIQDSDWPMSGDRRDRVAFTYDDLAWLTEVGQAALADELFPDLGCNLRGRVSGAIALRGSDEGDHEVPWRVATWYCYDVSGYVRGIVQDLPELAAVGQRLSRITYRYGLPEGSVREVQVHVGDDEALTHRYTYDRDGRLTRAETSADGVVWDTEGTWDYYQHGPVARAELGDAAVQGLDYAYTLLGWLKGINSDTLKSGRDPGGDGDSSVSVRGRPADVFGETIAYYEGDYKAIGDSARKFEASKSGLYSADRIAGLYDGNVAATSMATSPFLSPAAGHELAGDPHVSTYGYDQLGRLLRATTLVAPTVIGKNAWPSSAAGLQAAFMAEHRYDPNGNFDHEAAAAGTDNAIEREALGKPMDALKYLYPADAAGEPSGNRLLHVQDEIASGAFADDVDDQGTGCDQHTGTGCNFQYDPVGNLTQDAQRKVDSVSWTAYGKPEKVELSGGAVKATQVYDAFGNRVALRVDPQAGGLLALSGETWGSTWSIRGASGELLTRIELEVERVCAEGTVGAVTLTVPAVSDAGASPLVGVTDAKGRDVVGVPVHWQGNPEATAIALAAAIDLHGGAFDYDAEALSDGALKLTPVDSAASLAMGLRVLVGKAPEDSKGGLDWREPTGMRRLCEGTELVATAEHHIYGLGRVGTRSGGRRRYAVPTGQELVDEGGALAEVSLAEAEDGASEEVVSRYPGDHRYELSDHLGDVVAVVSGEVRTKTAFTGAVRESATVMMAVEYAPFGQPMPGRTYERESYPMGFSGQETDHGLEGDVAYGTRTYRADLGRFTSVDSIASEFPWYSPYQFAGNSPIGAVDLEGKEPAPTNEFGSNWSIPALPNSATDTTLSIDPEREAQLQNRSLRFVFYKTESPSRTLSSGVHTAAIDNTSISISNSFSSGSRYAEPELSTGEKVMLGVAVVVVVIAILPEGAAAGAALEIYMEVELAYESMQSGWVLAQIVCETYPWACGSFVAYLSDRYGIPDNPEEIPSICETPYRAIKMLASLELSKPGASMPHSPSEGSDLLRQVVIPTARDHTSVDLPPIPDGDSSTRCPEFKSEKKNTTR